MRISKEKAQQNHDQIVDVAARLFRERGFDGIGVADLMKTAGFTHGGFYNHFSSKDALAVEATQLAFRQRRDLIATIPGIEDILKLYISGEHVEDLGGGCPSAGLGGDAARQPDDVKAIFGSGIEGMIAVCEGALDECAPHSPTERRARAINMIAKAVGAVVLARAVPGKSPLAQEIVDACLAGALTDATRVA